MDSAGNRTLTTTENIADYHDGLCELFCGPEMLSLLRTLAGEEMVLFKEKINYKVDRTHLPNRAQAHITHVKSARSGGFKAHVRTIHSHLNPD